MKLTVRVFACLLASFAGSAFAAGPGGYPARPVKIVVPFAPAGPTDVMARLIAQKLSESLGQQFFVENHAGAGGNIGMTLVAKSTPCWSRHRAMSSIRASTPTILTTPTRISRRSPSRPHRRTYW